MPTYRTHLATALGIAVLTTILTAGGAGAHDADDHQHDRLTGQQAALIRTATTQLRDVDAALAAGYVPVGDCAELPSVGGMGFHYLHPGLASDDVVDPAHPELLVYRATSDGGLRLSAVEFFVADADQDLATDDDRPALFGTHPFDGPMPGHEPGMPVHYDLHVWLYDHNPAGQLAAWNPRATC